VRAAVGLLVSLSVVVACAGCLGQQSFDRAEWIAAGNKCTEDNPRRAMVDDLMDSRLKSGLRRRDVRDLLGKPESAYRSRAFKGWEWNYTVGVGASCETLFLAINGEGRLFKWAHGES
jgi:outer membrane protein assembly factor BamE (lipoprotein component of BamABCDE complex)